MKKILLFFIAVLSSANLFAAREIIAVNDNWRFYFSSENSADYARTISLPHTWSYDQSRLLISSQPTTANYIKDLFVPAQWAQKRIFIKFYGVQSVADVMVNGRYLGEHRGGATAFTFELTNLIKVGESNRVHVIVNDAPQKDILPTSYEEDLYGGIYRDVELIVTDKIAVSPLHYGSDGVFIDQKSVSKETAEGAARVYLNSTAGHTCQLTLSIFDDTNKVVFQKSVAKAKIGNEPISIPFAINAPKLWSPDSPNLYSFVIDASDDDNSDQVRITSGFRSIETVEGGAIKINGEPTQFKGVSLYHDYPHVGGAASKRDIEADVDLICELGANAIRSSSHPHHPYLYDLCDELGKLVWIDFPLVKAPFLSDVAYYPTARFHEQGRETLREIVAQNYNHPSVIMWGVFSLLSTRGDNSIPYIRELNALAKQLDESRPTVAVSDQDGDINTITDLIVWNQSLGWEKGQFADIDVWSNMLHSKWSNMLSAVTYGQNGRIDQQSEASNYKSINNYNTGTWKPEGRQRVFHEQYAQRIVKDTLFWGVCINSMFDFKSSRNALGENNSGLVTFDRRNRKDIFYLYKANWNRDEKTLHIADSRMHVSTKQLYSVSVYASDTIPPTLCTQLDTIKMKRVAPWHFVADTILLTPGANKIVVKQGEMADSVNVVYEQAASSSISRRKPFATR